MTTPKRSRYGVLLAALLTLLAVQPASAQIFESVGIRAQGMGGAFIAVADDASATWWNPAGLATGALFSGIVEHRKALDPNEETTLGVAFSVPSLGVSYYRLRLFQNAIPDPTGSSTGNRQDPATAGLPTFVFKQVGVTVGQSLGAHAVLASTLKLVHADDTRGDVDIGLMIKVGSARAGVVVKHLHEPDLQVGGIEVELSRQARVGIAYAPAPGPTFGGALSLDADLTTMVTPFGESRRLAGGGELMVSKRLGVRGGISVNTVGERRSSFSAGGSAAVDRGIFLDAQVTRGDDEAKRGWGFDLRVTF